MADIALITEDGELILLDLYAGAVFYHERGFVVVFLVTN